MHTPTHSLLLLLLFYPLFLAATHAAAVTEPPSPSEMLLLPSDAVLLLSFKSKADLDNKLLYALNEQFDYCQWQGVKCLQGRVVRFVLQGFGLRGHFPADTLNKLERLRTLSLKNNSLSGPIPDLSGLTNLRTLLLGHNYFSGTFPPSLLSLHRLLTLDLSHNNFTGPIPTGLNALDRISYLRLDSNLFNGSIPQLNQTTLVIFNVSNNNLNGPVPLTPTLKKFSITSFRANPNLCGDVVNRPCRASPFFESPNSAASPLQNAHSQGGDSGSSVILSPPTQKKHTRTGAILGFLIGTLIFIAAVLCLFALFKKQRQQVETKNDGDLITKSKIIANSTNSVNAEPEINEKKKTPVPVPVPAPTQASGQPRQQQHQHHHKHHQPKSGSLIFCDGEPDMYTLEQLMRASAELLGRGTIGTTYKAVMDNQLIVSVKRLDACKTTITSGEAFEDHMEAVGVLRHPNLAAIRAYFQAKQERLIIFDYQPNGSLFNLVHGSRSTRAKPLHWTSCLKIAEDVAHGLAYIHQASSFVHGNLKSSNVLLGSDFEACLTDYCLAILADTSPNDDPDSAGYKAPEIRKSLHRATVKSDVYAFGILLLELLSGKPPSQHPPLAPLDVPDWVRVMRDDNDEDDQPLRMLVELATVCSLTSPEQRPTVRQVLKMVQDIKESAMVESGADDPDSGYS